jgi:hypothetical protein
MNTAVSESNQIHTVALYFNEIIFSTKIITLQPFWINSLKPIGNYIYHILKKSVIFYLRISYNSQCKGGLFT